MTNGYWNCVTALHCNIRPPCATVRGPSNDPTSAAMAIDDAALDKLAFLARLELPESTRDSVRADLERMLGFVDALQQADVDGIEPMAHPAASQSVLRTDQADTGDRRRAASGRSAFRPTREASAPPCPSGATGRDLKSQI